MSKQKQAKGKSGEAAAYISRSRAMKRLQVSLVDFRRLCILKGVYPRDPKHKKRVIKAAPGGGGQDKAFYALKDIQYLASDPLLTRIREEKSLFKKMARWRVRGEQKRIERAQEEAGGSAARLPSALPSEHLARIVRERYPTFADALRDCDDAVSMVSLFARLPTPPFIATSGVSSVRADWSQECAKLYAKFRALCAASRCILRSFISIKGIYYQAEPVPGHTVTWCEPLEGRAAKDLPSDVDFRVMLSFLELYMTVLRFVIFRLEQRLGASKTQVQVDGSDEKEWDSWTDLMPKNVPEDCQDVLERQCMPSSQSAPIFTGMTFWLGRECPKEALTLLIISGNGQIASDELDMNITHCIMDRPVDRVFAERVMVQPQWVWDSLNAQKCLDSLPYALNAILPPHYSPFEAKPEQVLAQQLERDAMSTMSLEQREMAASLLSRKARKAYDHVAKSQSKRRDRILA